MCNSVVSIYKFVSAFVVVMGNIHTVGPNEALIVSGKTDELAK